ncbi:MAG TPA: GerMN domain-containing protein [Symbiobacteriaceae bacterium]|nr:GerMN domain-containing protein [Symbiobacteriaceae bacterium]
MQVRRLLLALLVLAILAAGFGLRSLAGRIQGEVVTLYFPDLEQSRLVGVARAVTRATPEATVAELVAGPAPDTPLLPALPAGARVEVTGEDGNLTLTVDPVPGPLAREALARSVLGLPSVRSVIVAGRRWTADEVRPAPGESLVYYPDRGLPAAVPTPLPATDGVDGMRAAVTAFLTNPPPSGLAGPPAGITLADLTVKGDVAHVRLSLSPDLTRTLTAGGWNFSPYYMSVIYTLTEFPGIRRVQFEFTGLTAVALQQCRTPLSVPLPRPAPERRRT